MDTRSTHWTPYAEIDEFLNGLLGRMQGILGEQLVGLYLYGSLVAGDFDPEISDIDLLAATAADLSEQESARLHKMHDDFATKNPAWFDRVEVAYVSVTALKTFRSQASPIAAISPGEPFHIKEAGADWLVNWWVVRERGVTLYGPPISELIDPITKDEFLHSVQEHALMWPLWVHDMQEPKAQAYVILTMCRALYALENSEQPSKKKAARWAQARLPQWAPLIGEALELREAETHEIVHREGMFVDTFRFVNFAAGSIEGPAAPAELPARSIVDLRLV